VLAGVNGSGKSSIHGEMLLAQGATVYNPDHYARMFREQHPILSQAEANSQAWYLGVRLLRYAMDADHDFTFETTLAGTTITTELERAQALGHRLSIWYVGLADVEDNIRRVRQRHQQGGHDIPEADIRRRFLQSPANLVRLLGVVCDLVVFDNTADRDPTEGKTPELDEILRVRDRNIVSAVPVVECPDWARWIVERSIEEFAA
jgi:predicted ABC-type ATPase